MNDKISISIDCEKESENHIVRIGDYVIECKGLEELGDVVESLMMELPAAA